jgi:hypothetical protein
MVRIEIDHDDDKNRGIGQDEPFDHRSQSL